MLKIVADLHTHTNVSAHAYSTLQEMVRGAKNAGLSVLAMTNHGPSMEDGAHEWHFSNMNIIPKEIDGIRLVRGIEFNICAPAGGVDIMDANCLRAVEFSLASFHDCCFPPSSVETHTVALESILRNPYVRALGHMGNNKFAFDQEKIISQCNAFGKIVEINNNSLFVRAGCRENCKQIARLCKKYEVPVAVNSDAHIEYMVGHVPDALAMLEEVGFPEELVINSSMERLEAYFDKIGVTL